MSKFEVKVRKITSIKPHPNADKLEIARVDGFDWDCIIGKEQFKVGDLAVYVPIDSVIPPEMVEALNMKVSLNKGRIKAVRIRGEVSYGLLLTPKEGMKNKQEVSELLGIKKYEQPPNLRYARGGNSVTKKKLNPLFDKYTDIENVKYYPDTFLEGEEVVVEEKIHGTNFRAGKLPRKIDGFWDRIKVFFGGKYELCVGSRTVQLNPSNPSSTWYQLQGKHDKNIYIDIFNTFKFKNWLPEDTVVYGEIYGTGVQDLTYGLKGIEFVCFDVKVKGNYLNYDDRQKFCKEHGLTTPTLLYRGKWTQDCLENRKGNNIAGVPDTHIREGVVIRSSKERNAKELGRVILKCINEEYLLRSEGTEFH